MIAKREPILSVKNPGLEVDPNTVPVFLRSIDDFRKRRRFHRFITVKPFIEYLSSVNKRKDFYKFCNELEEFRCNVLGMNKIRFYKLATEFFLVQNGRSYYNPNHLFGCNGSYEAEEFRTRIFETLVCISLVVGLDANEVETLNFLEELTALKNSIDVSSGMLFRTKDWFCVESIRNIILSRGWTIEEGMHRMKVFYRMRIKKVYPEMLLHDLVKGELNHVKPKVEVAKKRKVTVNQIIENEHWDQSVGQGG